MPGIWGFPVTHIFNDPVKVLRTRGRVRPDSESNRSHKGF